MGRGEGGRAHVPLREGKARVGGACGAGGVGARGRARGLSHRRGCAEVIDQAREKKQAEQAEQAGVAAE